MKTLIQAIIRYQLSVYFILFACLSYNTHAKQETTLSFAHQEVAPGLYMLSGVGGFTGGNIALSTGPDGPIMIDDAFDDTLPILQQAIQQITKKPIQYLLNTHYHGDHIGNNAVFSKQGANIIAHDNVRSRLQNKGMMTPTGLVKVSKESFPVITYTKKMTLHFNHQEAQLIHLGHAHTDGDTLVYFNNANVIHAGDVLFNGMYPYIDLASGGSVDGYIDAQKKILALADETTKIIPGHGPLASKQDLQKSLDMLVACKYLIVELIQQGKTEEQIVALNPLKKFTQKWQWGFISTEKMTRQLYQGLIKNYHVHDKNSPGSHTH